MARSKTWSSRKTQKAWRISFPRFSILFCTIPKTEKSEICSEVVSSNSEVLWSNSEVFHLRVFHFECNAKMENSELENLGV